MRQPYRLVVIFGFAVVLILVLAFRWALEKAPGYPLLVVPFYWLGLPHLTNVILALATLAVIYPFLRQLFDERVACLGCLLFLFTPANLAMFHESYMAMFATSAP